MKFLKNYDIFENLPFENKKEVVLECARFYENKTLDYILSNMPKEKQKNFKKEPLEVIFVDNGVKDVSFGNNVITILDDFLFNSKKEVFFRVAQASICAVFVNLFYNTASDPNKKTKFSTLADGYLATITSEFSQNQTFETDMMNEYAEILSEMLGMEIEM